MTTLYDIGDEIKITLVGKVIGYSMSREGGDNYLIEIVDNRKNDHRICFSTEELRGRSYKVKDAIKE